LLPKKFSSEVMSEKGAFSFLVNSNDSGKRLDVVVSSLIPLCSRNIASRLIQKGMIRVHDALKKPGYRVKSGETICGRIPPPEPLPLEPEPIRLNIVYEDKYIIVINKQPGLVVHPAPGHYTGTLVNGLLYHCPDLEGVGGKIRAGIVHRLDKDTSGIMVVAKTHLAHTGLASQFKNRTVQKKYLAVVYGEMDSKSGSITLPIGRHPSNRKKMSTFSRRSRFAETTWKVREPFDGATLLELNLKTGRTHQIRVHCAAVNHPVVGDPVYCPRKRTDHFINKRQDICTLVKSASRQMLHAWRLKFTHPVNGESLFFEAPVHEDMKGLIAGLKYS